MIKGQYTPWFDGAVKPVRRGWYLRDYGAYTALSKWTGKRWVYWPGWGPNLPCPYPNVPWRGIAKRP